MSALSTPTPVLQPPPDSPVVAVSPPASGHDDVPEIGAQVGAGLPVAAAGQWLSTTVGRVVACPFSWMQAVHWVAGAGLHQPRRGPRFGATTLQIARLLAELSPCRPGIAFLMRRTGLSERTVQYHLAALREMGLLAYTVRGTRRRGEQPLASEFMRVIPPAFDAALGIRTVGEGTTRRCVGISDQSRPTIAKLATAAARRKPRKRPRKPRPTKTRCTPMQGSSTRTSTADRTTDPLEAELASGQTPPPAPNKHRKPRTLNQVGRRWQLSRELANRVPWLSRSSIARNAWVLSQVADAGWTVDEVEAWLDLRPPPRRVHRISGLLSQRLKGATETWKTTEQRNAGRIAARDSRTAEHTRHTETWDGAWKAPTDHRIVTQTLAGLRQGIAAYEARQRAQGLDLPTPNTPADKLNDPQYAAESIAAFLGL